MKTTHKLAIALSFAFGVTVPIVAMAQMTPTAPKAPDLSAPAVSPSGAPIGGPSMGSSPAEASPMMMPSSTVAPVHKMSTPSSSKSKMMKPVAAKVNINSATMAELVKVNGIGPVTAKKIVAGRPYATLSELVTKKVMQTKQFAAVKTQLTAP